MPDERVTLTQIAANVGLSPATVSKVLNGRPDVGAGTRARVEAELARHGYRSRAARPRGLFIELVFHELVSGWSLEIIKGVQQTADAAGLGLLLAVSGTRRAPGPEWIDEVLQRGPAAVILVFPELPAVMREKLRSRGIPYVLLDPTGDPPAGVPAVVSANWSGGLAATRHLINLGHTRIAIITGPDDVLASAARLDGYRSAMSRAGLWVDPRWIRRGDFGQASAARETTQLLLLPPADRPTAVFSCSDIAATGVIAACRAAGLGVPADFSVVGYDDVPVSWWMTPPLTTVHQPLRKMGETATRLALRLLDGGRPEAMRTDLSTHLVVRGSTNPPPDI